MMTLPVMLGAGGVVLFLFGYGSLGLLLLALGIGVYFWRQYATA